MMEAILDFLFPKSRIRKQEIEEKLASIDQKTKQSVEIAERMERAVLNGEIYWMNHKREGCDGTADSNK
jgi:hypothetical protein